MAGFHAIDARGRSASVPTHHQLVLSPFDTANCPDCHCPRTNKTQGHSHRKAMPCRMIMTAAPTDLLPNLNAARSTAPRPLSAIAKVRSAISIFQHPKGLWIQQPRSRCTTRHNIARPILPHSHLPGSMPSSILLHTAPVGSLLLDPGVGCTTATHRRESPCKKASYSNFMSRS